MRWLCLVMLAACVDSAGTQCADGTLCPGGSVCAPVSVGGTSETFCVDATQVTSCSGMADGATCMFGSGSASCHDGVCFSIACGNRLVDPGEACDDGNANNGDGCSADCKSTEKCGNGVIDA